MMPTFHIWPHGLTDRLLALLCSKWVIPGNSIEPGRAAGVIAIEARQKNARDDPHVDVGGRRGRVGASSCWEHVYVGL